MAVRSSGLEAGGNHSEGSNLVVVVYLLRFNFFIHFFSVYFFSTYFCPLACFPVFSLGPFTASQDFCDDVFLV